MFTMPFTFFKASSASWDYSPLNPMAVYFMPADDLWVGRKLSTNQHEVLGGGSDPCFKFGSSRFLSVPDSDDFDFAAVDFCIQLWMRRNVTTSVSEYICGQMDSSVSAASTQVYKLSNNAPQMVLRNTLSAFTVVTSSQTITDTSWHHVAFVRESNYFRIFVDGVNSANALYTRTLLNSASSFSVGRAGDYNSVYFDGDIQDFQVTKGSSPYSGTSSFTPPARGSLSLSDTNCKMLMHAEGDKLGGVTTSTYANSYDSTGALEFNGPSFVITAGSYDFGTQDFTIDFWMRPTSTASCDIFSARQTATFCPFLLSMSSGALQFSCSAGSTWDVDSLSVGTATLSTWQHIAVTRKNGVFYTYKDGAYASQESATVSIATADVLRAGGIESLYMSGSIDKPRVILGEALHSGTTSFTPPART